MNELAKKDVGNKGDYLDVEKLMIAYTPLMKSIYKRFSKFNNLFHSQADYEDLEAQIQFEFVKLCNEYNPARGVDFPGFIKFHLQQRVYHHVTKLQKVRQKETLAYTREYDGEQDDSIDFNNSQELIDEDAIKAFERVEALACLDWSVVSGKKHKWLIEAVLFEHKTLEEIAAEEGVGIKVIRLRLYFACNYLMEHAKYLEEMEQARQLQMKTAQEIVNNDENDFSLSTVIRKPIITRKPIRLED